MSTKNETTDPLRRGSRFLGDTTQPPSCLPALTNAKCALQLYTISETCEILSVSRWQVYQLINSKELGSVKIRRRRLVPTSAIVDYLASLRARAQA